MLRFWLFRLSSQKPLAYYLILFPGVIIHELSHVLACLITFTRIKTLKLFSKNGGFVIHNKPRFLAVSFIISIAPFITGLSVLFITMRYLSSQGISSLVNITGLFMLYFLSSIIITMLPSRQDLQNAWSVYLAIIIAMICYYFLSTDRTFFWRINSLMIFSCIVLLAINFIFYLLNNSIWKSKSQ